MSSYNWNHSPMQFMIYSNKTHMIINVIGLLYIKRVGRSRHRSKSNKIIRKNIIHCQSKGSCTSRNQIVPYHWQNINSITTGVASDNCDVMVSASPFTNYKIPSHSGQISFLVDQFSRCLFVHNKIHKIGESCKLGNGNDFLTAQATPLSSTAHFSCWASSR